VRIARLFEDVRETSCDAGTVGRLCESRKGNDRNHCRFGKASELRQDRKSVFPRHFDVEEHGVRVLLARRFHGGIAVACREHIEPSPSQDLDVQLLRLSIIVHDQYPWCLDFFHYKTGIRLLLQYVIHAALRCRVARPWLK
jgi:hypothetical protein